MKRPLSSPAAILRAVLLTFGATAAVAFAQAPAAPAAKPAAGQRSLRLLPLGEPPPFRQDVRDGVRYELEPDPGSIPPRQVVLGEGDTISTIRLNLGRATEPVKLPLGTAPANLRSVALAPDAPAVPWLTLQPPESGDLLALLWRDPGKPWSQPRSLLLPDSAAAFPAGNIRIVNLLPVETALICGEDRMLLASGKSLLRAIPVGADLPLQIAYREQGGQLKRFHSGSILLNQGERAQVVLHRADGENPRQPAKVVIFSEATPGAKPAAADAPPP